VDDLLFTRDDIVANRTAVADLLYEEGSSQRALIVVGGSFLALQGFRRSTADVDTLTRIDESLRRAVGAIASRQGLRTDWLQVPPGYPHEADEDPHLVEYVQRIADTSRGQSAPVR
jgi:hypothetical protein